MTEQKAQSIEKTINMLMRLDAEALILIENSAETLKKYQDLRNAKEKKELQEV